VKPNKSTNLKLICFCSSSQLYHRFSTNTIANCMKRSTPTKYAAEFKYIEFEITEIIKNHDVNDCELNKYSQ
jgi:hypothetical protein